MDHRKLLRLISRQPQLWDKSCLGHDDKQLQETLWNIIGKEMGNNPRSCRNTFESLCGTYLRERRRGGQWELLDEMRFLDGHLADTESTARASAAPRDFARRLISMVRDVRPLWDRRNRDYDDEGLKERLWTQIADSLKADPTACRLKWVALVKKYAAEKEDHVNGASGKFKYYKEMSFLGDDFERLDENFNFLTATVDSRPLYTVLCSVVNQVDKKRSSSSIGSRRCKSLPDQRIPSKNNLFYQPDYHQEYSPSPTTSRAEAKHREDHEHPLRSSSSKNHHHRSLPNLDSTGENGWLPKGFASSWRGDKGTKSEEQNFGEFVAMVLEMKGRRQRKRAIREIIAVLLRND